MVAEWRGTSWTQAGVVALSAVCIYAAIIATVRVIGLRAFAKISAFDAATTVAIGAIFASVTITSTSLTSGLVGLVVIFALQKLLAIGRLRGHVNRWVDNQPRLLMLEGEFIEDGLRDCEITRHDVVAKLRLQGVTSFDEVAAVVLETTGEMSVLTSQHGFASIDPRLFDNVAGVEQNTVR